MRMGETSEAVVEQLETLLASAQLPSKATLTAKHLIERLSSPVRITLLGPRSAGKSTLAKVLAGAAFTPDDLRLPSTEIRFADHPGLAVTLGDGSRREVPSLDFDAALALSPSFLEIRAPLPALRKFSLLEMVTDGSDADLSAAARWAARRTDMAIWVTPHFDQRQQDIWRSVPEEMKDHGFLALSKTDILSATERRQALVADNPGMHGDFIAVFRVAAKQELAVIEGVGFQATGALHDTGCKDLIDKLTRHVETGSQADVDGARLFLRRFTNGPSRTSGPKKRVETENGVGALPDAEGTPVEREIESLADLTMATALAEHEHPRPPALDSGAEAALAVIRANAEELFDEFARVKNIPTGHVLDCCARTFESLVEVVPEDNDLHCLVVQASDFVVLLLLEKNEQAAHDAVIALLQMKRDFEQALAA